ncbi:MBL fold metallo-hydrolase [Deltaproteobacteria bacterium PRO3]|nr:MBL fold metallo-hydrolase [Deltaproteobacteria bacterium PRO3]
MANPLKKVPENQPGEFFVDSSCIDCDTCRQLAPSTFADAGEYSYVKAQPVGEDERRLALRALLACPTSSIGTTGKASAREAMEDFPLPIAEEVFYCGFNAEASFGANSYFVRHAEGNWLIDAPRFLPFLAKKFEAMGGLRYVFLTHRDDVADAGKYAERFGAQLIIHRADADAAPGAEILLEGEAPRPFGNDFLILPTPGHTRGHCVLLYRGRFLFTGDHLAYSRARGHLIAFRNANWYSWPETIRSMEKLQDYDFEWVLPGHGERLHLPANEMRAQLRRAIEWMKSR